VLRFEEDVYWGEGGAMAMPAEHGYIYGMAAFRNAATGTGVGALLVFGRNGVVAFDVSMARTDWGVVSSSQVLFSGTGTVSPWALTPINGDLVFRGLDGLRSVRFTQAWVGGGSGSLHNMPTSVEASDWFRPDDALALVSTAFSDHWLLTTVEAGDLGFQGVVALDAVSAYSLSDARAPVFAGLWTGLNVQQLVMAQSNYATRTFVVAQGPEIWIYDNGSYDDNGTAIESRVVLRSFGFDDGFAAKTLQHVDLWVTDIRKPTTIRVYFRPTGYPKWNLVGSERTVEPHPTGEPGYQRRLRFSVDNHNDLVDSSDLEHLAAGTEIQVAIEFTGCMAIERGLVVADLRAEEPPDPEDHSLLDAELGGTVFNDFSYKIGG
jgi:hypothetical protein